MNDVRNFAKAILHGDEDHQKWLLEAAEAFAAGEAIPEVRGDGNTITALRACVKAMRDVQEFWSDPGSYTHSRLETPLLVHAETIKRAS